MKLKKITRLKNLTKQEANKLINVYEDEGYETELIPMTNGKAFGDKYELHVYKQIRRIRRWYTYDYL